MVVSSAMTKRKATSKLDSKRESKQDSNQELIEVLRSRGLRATPLRIVLLQVLRGASQPHSIETLHQETRRAMKNQRVQSRGSFDLVTLYRNINSFEQVGFVSKVEIGTGRSLYEFVTPVQAHRHHVICTDCEKIEYLDVCGLEPHLKILEERGYRKLRHRLQFSGICSKCS